MITKETVQETLIGSDKPMQLNSFLAGTLAFIIIAGVLLSPLSGLPSSNLLLTGGIGIVISGLMIYIGLKKAHNYSQVVEGVLIGCGYGIGFISGFTVITILAGVGYESIAIVAFVPLALIAFPAIIGYLDQGLLASCYVAMMAALGFIFPLFAAGFPAVPPSTDPPSIATAIGSGIIFATLIGAVVGAAGYIVHNIFR
ncbi:hypothetical protein [Natronobacterium texcoconense]|uniref:Uncharacterized protein n=1 Tax=Natronobacterium texcoconense TaxID=1095778 RepID=A0A1H1F1Z4_NATTX|nr:hypothetical protein [Natronobacterium texcoconense]SDQ94921.1 hypothetical protein SAMN04489842_1786 [Natronobacterium texcoconense]